MADTTSTGSAGSTAPMEKGWGALKQHALENKIKVGLWITRVFTMVFTIGYIIPIIGNPYNAYHKALMSCAATSALRLHQRLPQIQFNRQFWNILATEDSFHYLFYALIFLYVSPITLVLLPIFLFALLHSASYSLTLLDCLGQNSWWGARFAISLVEFQSRNMLRMCAMCEIMILPFTILLVFTGRAGLLTPFVYYQFLKFRLASRRNPYTRNAFFEIRSAISRMTVKPNIPYFLRRVIQTFLMLTQNMVPEHYTANTQ